MQGGHSVLQLFNAILMVAALMYEVHDRRGTFILDVRNVEKIACVQLAKESALAAGKNKLFANHDNAVLPGAASRAIVELRDVLAMSLNVTEVAFTGLALFLTFGLPCVFAARGA